MKRKQMTYSELVHHVKKDTLLTTRWLVLCWLMDYQNIVTPTDLSYIRHLYVDGIVKE